MRYVDLLFPFFLRILGFAGWTPSGRSSLSHAQTAEDDLDHNRCGLR
jgi:hypothetical protein